jgi:hypothetical protein
VLPETPVYHWYVMVPLDVAVTLSVAELPEKIFCATGCCVIDGGLQTVTVIVALFVGQRPSAVTRHQ